MADESVQRARQLRRLRKAMERDKHISTKLRFVEKRPDPISGKESSFYRFEIKRPNRPTEDLGGTMTYHRGEKEKSLFVWKPGDDPRKIASSKTNANLGALEKEYSQFLRPGERMIQMDEDLPVTTKVEGYGDLKPRLKEGEVNTWKKKHPLGPDIPENYTKVEGKTETFEDQFQRNKGKRIPQTVRLRRMLKKWLPATEKVEGIRSSNKQHTENPDRRYQSAKLRGLGVAGYMMNAVNLGTEMYKMRNESEEFKKRRTLEVLMGRPGILGSTNYQDLAPNMEGIQTKDNFL